MDKSNKILSKREYNEIKLYLKEMYGEEAIISFYPEGRISVRMTKDTKNKDLIRLKIIDEYWLDTNEEEREKRD